MDLIFFLILFLPGAYFVLKPIFLSQGKLELETDYIKEAEERKENLIRELKNLKRRLDEGEISQEEYDRLKESILEELYVLVKKFKLKV